MSTGASKGSFPAPLVRAVRLSGYVRPAMDTFTASVRRRTAVVSCNEGEDVMSEKPRVAHCWEDGPETEDGCSTTCMLLDGHEGPHEFTRDDQIGITFAPAEIEASFG